MSDEGYPEHGYHYDHDYDHDQFEEYSRARADVLSVESPSEATQRRPTVLSLLGSTAINLILPFINGLMLGFGELFAHEIAFRLGWGTQRVFPQNRLHRRRQIGPGMEIRDDRQHENRSTSLEDLTSLE